MFDINTWQGKIISASVVFASLLGLKGCFTAKFKQPESKSNGTSLTISDRLPSRTQFQLAQRECYKKMSPYLSHSQAERERQKLRRAGYSTSGVWGEGGVISDWSNRRYYFNVFYQC